MGLKAIHHCASPLPGEWWPSIILRTADELGIPREKFLQMIIPEFKSILCSQMPFLSYFDNPEEIFKRSELFWTFICLTETEISYILDYLHGKIKSSSLVINWLLSSLVIKSPRFCKLCVHEDLEKYGLPYYHTVHQIPDIPVCPFHSVYLNQINSGDWVLKNIMDSYYLSEQTVNAEKISDSDLILSKELLCSYGLTYNDFSKTFLSNIAEKDYLNKTAKGTVQKFNKITKDSPWKKYFQGPPSVLKQPLMKSTYQIMACLKFLGTKTASKENPEYLLSEFSPAEIKSFIPKKILIKEPYVDIDVKDYFLEKITSKKRKALIKTPLTKGIGSKFTRKDFDNYLIYIGKLTCYE